MKKYWDELREFEASIKTSVSIESFPGISMAIHAMKESDVIMILDHRYYSLLSTSPELLQDLYSKLNEYGVILTSQPLPSPFQILAKLDLPGRDLSLHVQSKQPGSIAEPVHDNNEELQIVCISDTHNLHRHMPTIPYGDILIHAGDFSNTGEFDQIADFIEWLHGLPHRVKILIAGNHDLTVHESFYEHEGRTRFHGSRRGSKAVFYDPKAVRAYLKRYDDIIYLEDNGVTVSIPSKLNADHTHRLKIYGSPWQPEFHSWAFNAQRGEEILGIWKKIPSNIDILITHGPPYGYGDLCVNGNRAGCKDLLAEIRSRIRPRLHVFGHIHEDVGMWNDSDNGRTTYVNACICNLQYWAVNHPVVVTYPVDITKQPRRRT